VLAVVRAAGGGGWEFAVRFGVPVRGIVWEFPIWGGRGVVVGRDSKRRPVIRPTREIPWPNTHRLLE
jgi:hypothetical protein